MSTSDNGIKVLANADGIRLVRSIESRTLDSSRVASGSMVKVRIWCFGTLLCLLHNQRLLSTDKFVDHLGSSNWKFCPFWHNCCSEYWGF